MAHDHQNDFSLPYVATTGYLADTFEAADLDGFVDPWLEINVKNLAWNVSQVRKRVGDLPIMAVVKCNAYGHGTVEIARALDQNGIHQFAVVKVLEATALRESGIKGMILNFGPFSGREAELLVRHDISQSVFSDAVELLAAAARRQNKKARVHIKVDTGMSRVGVPFDRALPFIEKVAAMPEICIEGIFTVLTEEADFDPLQIERLAKVSEEAKKKGISTGVRHAASSGGVSRYPSSQYLDMVRMGNAFYGFDSLPNMELKPTMSLKTRVILVKTLQPGATIAYHRRKTVETEMRLATLPIGYTDGYPFQAVNKAEVLIRGRRLPLIVYMSANHAFIDVTSCPEVEIGDEVVLFGRQGDQEITLDEVAQWADSSVYKVASAMSPFLPRIYMEK